MTTGKDGNLLAMVTLLINSKATPVSAAHTVGTAGGGGDQRRQTNVTLAPEALQCWEREARIRDTSRDMITTVIQC